MTVFFQFFFKSLDLGPIKFRNPCNNTKRQSKGNLQFFYRDKGQFLLIADSFLSITDSRPRSQQFSVSSCWLGCFYVGKYPIIFSLSCHLTDYHQHRVSNPSPASPSPCCCHAIPLSFYWSVFAFSHTANCPTNQSMSDYRSSARFYGPYYVVCLHSRTSSIVPR